VALFFDAEWFDARLAERSLNRGVLAAVSGMSEADVGLVFKDQRELSVAEVCAFAELLGVTPAEIANRAGVSTPAPQSESLEDRVAALEARLAALEAKLN
jgi:uncharacterized protein YceH (UPF0502 family)